MALHVLPVGVNMGVWGAFDIATGDSTITIRMSGIEDVTSTDRDLVSKAAVAFERILGAALPLRLAIPHTIGGRTMEGTDLNWRKSSYSGNGGGECAEIGASPGAVVVRDTTDRAGPMLRFAPGRVAQVRRPGETLVSA